jgi:hypothetical protein
MSNRYLIPRLVKYLAGSHIIAHSASYSEYGFIMTNLVSAFIQQEYLSIQLSEKMYRAKTYELMALQTQINPHFLFNTLETIHMCAFRLTDSANDVSYLIENLSGIMRYTLSDGRPLDLREISEKAKAVLEVWLPGTEGGSAIMDVITGASEPAGRLPMSFPYSVGQVPVYYNNYATGRPKQGKDDPAFYTSRYLDIPNEPLYPFGYGLSYTTFKLSSVSLSNDQLSKGDEGIEAWIDVTNIGSRPGTETLQLYIRDRFASAVRPVKELKGFQKVDLVPGETKRIRFKIREEMLRFYMTDGAFDSEPGIFELWIGNSSQTDNQAVFRLV